VIAAGGASLGAAALLSGHALKRSQRAALKLAGLLAVLAFVAPAMGMFVVPELLYDYFGLQAPAAAILGWLYLSLAALLIAVVVALWRAAELAYAAVASRYSA
jgi:chromate transport protein ChrA